MPRINPFVEQEKRGVYVYTENSENIDDLAGLLIDTHSGDSTLVEQARASNAFGEKLAHGSRVYAGNGERVYGLDGMAILSLSPISSEVEKEKPGNYVYTENSENIDDLAGLLIDTHAGDSPFAEKSREVTQWRV